MAIGIRIYSSEEKIAGERNTRGTTCARCGAPEESINHEFFECPPAVQVWDLSRIS